jgi:hypothetical protein
MFFKFSSKARAERCLRSALRCKKCLWIFAGRHLAMVASVINEDYPVKVIPPITEITEWVLETAGR